MTVAATPEDVLAVYWWGREVPADSQELARRSLAELRRAGFDIVGVDTLVP